MFSCIQKKSPKAYCFLVFSGFASLLILSQMSFGAAASFIDDVIISQSDDSIIQVTLKGQGKLDASPACYENPSRLVFDFNATILRYNKGQTKRIQIDRGNLNTIAIAQFQNNPEIARLVLYFNGGDAKTLLKETGIESLQGKFLIAYPAGNRAPIGETPKPKKEKVTDKKQIIQRLLHKRTGLESDRFILVSSKAILPSSSKFVSDRLILNFENFMFDIPENLEEKNRFVSPISGGVIDEITMINKPDMAVLELKMKMSGNASLMEYNLSYPNEGELQIDVMKSGSGDSSTTISPTGKQPTDFPEGEVTVILGGEEVPDEVLDKSEFVKIKRLKYVPISTGDRFILEVQNGELKPAFELYDNPPMLSMKVFNSSISTPEKGVGEYVVQVDGEISKELKIIHKKYGAIPEFNIQFLLKVLDIRKIRYDFYRADEPNVYNLDISFISAVTDQSSSGTNQDVEKEKSSLENLPLPDTKVEMGAQGTKRGPPKETEDSEKVIDVGAKSDDSEDRVIEVPRVDGGKVESEVEASGGEVSETDKTLVESKRFETVDIPKSDDSKALQTDILGKPVENEKKNEKPINEFSIGNVFMPTSKDWDSNNYPLMMLVMFNREKGSFVLYMIYLDNGKLRFERFP